MLESVENFNNQSKGEEIGNAITHGVGTIFAILGSGLVIVWAVLFSDVWGIVSASIFSFSLIILYLMSTLYHSLTNKKAKKVFQVFDHCSIFILILGTYTPFCLVPLRNSGGWVLFGINAFFTVLGIVLNSISVKKWNKISLVFYLLMGWSIVFFIKPVFELIPMNALWLLLAGGLSYTIGVIFYVAKKRKYMHMIWHFFVLAGSILHYIAILLYILPIAK